MEYEILRLNLLSPLFYSPDNGADPFNCPEDGERLFCFKLNQAQYLNFEPDKEGFIGSLIFSGKALDEGDTELKGEASLELPAGNYMFAQEKRLLNRDEIIDMAIEIQSETLWQRLKPEGKLFLRYLYEDGNWVTQLFRPYL